MACTAHAPPRGSLRWQVEGWQAIPAADLTPGDECLQCVLAPSVRRGDFDAVAADLRRVASRSHSPLTVINQYIESLPLPILVADQAGNYVGANFEAYALTGFSRKELLNCSVADLTPPADLSDEERLWKAFVRSDGQSGVYTLRCKDGRTLRVRYDAFTNIADGFHISFLTAPAPAS